MNLDADRQNGTSDSTRVRRLPERGHYDGATIYEIIDEALFCHVGFVDGGQPFVIPTIHVRIGDHLYLHGSPASRMLRVLAQGAPACVSITLLDGLVLARSAFHHSMNYRSVVFRACGAVVDDPEEKQRVFEALVEHIIPGRSQDARMPNEKEVRTTWLLRFPIEEASAKIRTGPPSDDDADYELPIWAGVIPLSLAVGTPVDDGRVPAEVELPTYAMWYARPKR